MTALKKLARAALQAILKPFDYTLAYIGHSSLGNSDSVSIVAQHLKELFEELEIDLVIDVGANLGQYRDVIRDRVEYKGLLLSFEPAEKLCDELRKRHLGDDNWIIHQSGLGNENGDKSFNVSKKSGWSSFLNKRETQSTSVGNSVELDYVETVSIRRLDDIIEELVPDFRERRIYLKSYLPQGRCPRVRFGSFERRKQYPKLCACSSDRARICFRIQQRARLHRNAEISTRQRFLSYGRSTYLGRRISPSR